ncbi:TIR domain-containing protein [Fusobacterium watanabei]|uniref:TIR domain-containing protein n=1 Tax=Fusobacterium watanabei TaxID=2686067 RepID=UPI003B586252
MKLAKKIFISYSWDNNEHKEWVNNLAEKLKGEGFDIYLDQCLNIGSNLNNFMNNIPLECDKILVICTPNYTNKANNYSDGVGRETRVFEIEENFKKVIPILRRGEKWDSSCIPSYLLSKKGIDMRDDIDNSSEGYYSLIQSLKICINKNFLSQLNDAGLFTDTHTKKKLELDDIYIPPQLILFDEEKLDRDKNIDLKNIIDKIGIDSKILIYGDDQAGKTSLCYHLYKELFSHEEIPIYLSGKIIKKFPKNIKNILKSQYSDENNLDNFDLKNCILIFDDFHLYKDMYDLNFLSDFKAVILVVNSIFQFNFRVAQVNSFKKFFISEFSKKLREKLFVKWINISSEDYIDNRKEILEIDNYHELIDKTLLNGIMPSYPFFILSILIGKESNANRLNSDITSRANCYSFLIYTVLEKCNIKSNDIDSYENILASMAFHIYNLKNSFDNMEIDNFFKLYEKRFLLPSNSSKEVILDKLCSAKVIYKNIRDEYEFKYPYLYYYFLSIFFTKNYINQEDTIDKILSNLQLEKNAYICMFLAYHSINDNFINKLISKSKELFKDCKTVTLNKEEMKFFSKNLDIEKLIYLSSEDDVRKARNENLEYQERLKNNSEEDLNEYIEDESDNSSDDTLLKDLYKSIRTIEVIGNIVKNRYGSLPIEQQKNIIQEAININLRIIQYFFTSIKQQKEQEAIITWIKTRLEHFMKNKKIENNKLDYLEHAKHIFWNIAYYTVAALIYQTIRSIGTKNLNRIITELTNSIETPAYSLIEHGIKIFYSYDIDVEKIKKDYKDYSYSFIAELIMKHLISLFSQYNIIDYRNKQRISEKLQIPLQTKIS